MGRIEHDAAARAQHATGFTERGGTRHEVNHVHRQDRVGAFVTKGKPGEIAADQRETSSRERMPIAARGLREHDFGPVEPNRPRAMRRTQEGLQGVARPAAQFEHALAVS